MNNCLCNIIDNNWIWIILIVLLVCGNCGSGCGNGCGNGCGC